jgi:hypothetical protein
MSTRIPPIALLLLLASLLAPGSALAVGEVDKYALESISTSLSSNQAGAHADFTLDFGLTEKENKPYAYTKELRIETPPGLIGNPQNFPRCTPDQFGEEPGDNECPQDAQIGVSEIALGGEINKTLIEPVYNMFTPGGDVVARFGVYAGFFPAYVNVRVNPRDYSLIATVEGAASAAELIAARTTLWGVPADSSHDALRLTPEEALAGDLPEGGRESGQKEIPFLSNPTDCSLTRLVTVTATSYQTPEAPSTLSAPYPQLGGCDKLSFNPKFTATPTTTEAAAASGLDAVLEIPQDETPGGRATSVMRSAVVSLPRGISINPAAADGLQACSASQVALGTNSPSACPDAAKLGSVEVEVPALEETLHGSVYQRTPEPGNLFGLWILTDEQGVHLKLPGQIEVDETSGQVSTVFSGIESLGGLPQVPFSELRLHIPGGPRAPLATPPSCGTYQTHYAFTPWSGRPATVGDAPMQITSGCNKGGFDPRLEAGSLSLRAGAFTPFTMTVTRQDGEANPQSLELTLPQGLLAKLAGVSLCPEPEASTGACPEASRIGAVTAAAGVGAAPLWIPQPGKAPTAIYLAGPYKGAPYSLLVRVPAQAGPFDLGTVLTRATIAVDPVTAQARIATDPLPQILQGVPVSYRAINALIDRPSFTLNPTDCEAKQIAAHLTAITGESADPRVGYQATNCARLAFKPRLTLRLKGKTRRTSHPALSADLRPRPGDANIGFAQVTLPKAAFLDNAHIGTVCTRVQFAAEACPAASVYGTAEAKTPLLDFPLTGTVYLRSSSHPLPDLVVAFRGPGPDPIRFELSGRTDSVKGALRNTFDSPPDVPVSAFHLELFGGKRGLIELSSGLCAHPRAKNRLEGQNGRAYQTQPKVKTSCAKAKGKRR